jgi:threonine/homoserine/homoserine lactone efflux protein
MDIFPTWPIVSAFLVSSLIIAVTPGPGVFYIVARSLMQGRRYGIVSVAGVALGNLGNAIGASLGLAALFTISSAAFTVVKYIGALYLVYLGINALHTPKSDNKSVTVAVEPLWRVFRDGLIVALFNPKTAVFFTAFLPQFIDTDMRPMLQSIALGSVFVVIAAVTDTLYALAAGAVSPVFTRTRGIDTLGNYLRGSVFIGLGVFTALAGNRGAT